jgi:hypothetical protein
MANEKLFATGYGYVSLHLDAFSLKGYIRVIRLMEKPHHLSYHHHTRHSPITMPTYSKAGSTTVSTHGANNKIVEPGETGTFRVSSAGCFLSMNGGEETQLTAGADPTETAAPNSRRFTCASSDGGTKLFDVAQGDSLTVTPSN